MRNDSKLFILGGLVIGLLTPRQLPPSIETRHRADRQRKHYSSACNIDIFSFFQCCYWPLEFIDSGKTKGDEDRFRLENVRKFLNLPTNGFNIRIAHPSTLSGCGIALPPFAKDLKLWSFARASK
jgi:hypothetical protein